MAKGRPSKLTRALLDKLVAIADDTWSVKDACDQIGISETTWRSWEATESDDGLLSEFLVLAVRVREGAGKKIDDLAWGTLRTVMEQPRGEYVKDPDDKHESTFVPGPSDTTRVQAAAAVLRLRTAQKVEVSGPDGGAITIRQLGELAAKEDA